MTRANENEWRRWGLRLLGVLKARRTDVTVEMSDFELSLIGQVEDLLGPNAESLVGAYPFKELLGALTAVGARPTHAKEMTKIELLDWMDEHLDEWQFGTMWRLLVER